MSTENTKEIENSEGHLDASHSVIVFPSLTTPALLRRGFPLDIIVVGDEVLKKRFEKEAAFKKGTEAGPEFMRFCHSHLSLVPWRGQKGKKKQQKEQTPDAQGGADQADDSPAEPPSAVNGRTWLSAMKDLASFRNMLYNKDKHLGPVKKFGTASKGWFIAEIQKSPKNDMTVGWEGNDKKPCGILSKEALSMYAASKDKSLRWLFHLRFGDIENTCLGMCELVWTCARYHRESNDHKNVCHYLPVEELILPLFTKEFVKGGKKALAQSLLNNSLPAQKEDDPLFDLGYAQRREHIYNMRSLGQSFSASDKERYMHMKVPTEDTERWQQAKELERCTAAVTQDGWQFGPRHPVFISEKERLNMGIVADPHISSRQSLYKMVGARVIPGVDQAAGSFEPRPACDYRIIKNPYSGKNEIEGSSLAMIEPPDIKDSPRIGPMCHENLQSARELMSRLGQQSDMIAFVGDMYDHIRNYDPQYYFSSGDARKTTTLWEAMDFYEKYKENFLIYPRFIDASLGLNLIYQSYAEGKPVCFVTGNHEAYEKAYGISPRIKIGNLWTVMKTNDGIPLDHNLTFYEAILLYGPGYPDMQKGRLSWNARDLGLIDIGLFEQENFLWTRLFLSPWKDINLTYGDKQDILMLDWKEGEQYVRNVPGDTLPIAKDAISADQFTLFEYFAGKNGSEAVSTQLLTHFTHVGYTHSLPLLRDKFAEPEGRRDDITRHKRDGEYWVILSIPPQQMSESKYNTGRFLRRVDEVWKKFAALPNAFAISGHTHRAGLYEEYGSGLETVGALNSPGIEKMESISLAGRKSPPILVSGSCGTYNKQNMIGEFAGRGMDKPQGMLLCLEKGKERVDIIRSNASLKPRLAVVLDYLWSDGKPLFVPQKNWSEILSVSSLHLPTLRRRIQPSAKHENHIVSGCPECVYSIELNIDVVRYFCSGPGKKPQNPIKTIKLHAVRKEDGAHVGCLVMHADAKSICENEGKDDRKENTVDSAQAMRITLNALGREVTYFLENYLRTKRCPPDNRLLFLSIHFAAGCDLFCKDHYDLSPWCFPVRPTLSSYGTYTLQRGWQNDDEGSEYPDFEMLGEIKEYDTKK